MVISIGDEEAEEGLRACLAKGADRALRVWEDSLGRRRPAVGGPRCWPPRSSASRPTSCSAGFSRATPSTAPPGVALAAHLGLPRVAVVKALDYDAASGSATVERELEGGLVELLRVGLPALLTIQTGINEPRYANLRAIKQAKEKPLEVLGLSRAGARRGRRRGGRGLARALDGAPRHGRRRGDARTARPSAVAERIAEHREGADERMSGILVVAESRRGELREVSLELVGAALALKDQAGGPSGGGGHRRRRERPHATTLGATGRGRGAHGGVARRETSRPTCTRMRSRR